MALAAGELVFFGLYAPREDGSDGAEADEWCRVDERHVWPTHTDTSVSRRWRLCREVLCVVHCDALGMTAKLRLRADMTVGAAVAVSRHRMRVDATAPRLGLYRVAKGGSECPRHASLLQCNFSNNSHLYLRAAERDTSAAARRVSLLPAAAELAKVRALWDLPPSESRREALRSAALMKTGVMSERATRARQRYEKASREAALLLLQMAHVHDHQQKLIICQVWIFILVVV